MEQNDYQNKRLDKMEKHIEVINGELGSIKTDVAWLKQFFWVVITASVGGLITGIINLIVK